MLAASQEAISLYGVSSLGWVLWPQGCLHCEDGTKQPYFREGLGLGPYLALVILNNLFVWHAIYITYLNSFTSDTLNHETESLDDAC